MGTTHNATRRVGHYIDGDDAISFELYSTEHYMPVPDAQALADAIYQAAGPSMTTNMQWRPVDDNTPMDGSRFWGRVGEDAVAMFWHPEFKAFVSKFMRMELAKGHTFADTGLTYQDHSPHTHEPDAWMPIPGSEPSHSLSDLERELLGALKEMVANTAWIGPESIGRLERAVALIARAEGRQQ